MKTIFFLSVSTRILFRNKPTISFYILKKILITERSRMCWLIHLLITNDVRGQKSILIHSSRYLEIVGMLIRYNYYLSDSNLIKLLPATACLPQTIRYAFESLERNFHNDHPKTRVVTKSDIVISFNITKRKIILLF